MFTHPVQDGPESPPPPPPPPRDKTTLLIKGVVMRNSYFRSTSRSFTLANSAAVEHVNGAMGIFWMFFFLQIMELVNHKHKAYVPPEHEPIRSGASHWFRPLTQTFCFTYTNMLISKKPGLPNANINQLKGDPNQANTNPNQPNVTPNASRWNIYFALGNFALGNFALVMSK